MPMIPTAEEIMVAMAPIAADGAEAPGLRNLIRLTQSDPVLGATVDHFVGLFSEMRQVTEPLARGVVIAALARGLYLGLRIGELRRSGPAPEDNTEKANADGA